MKKKINENIVHPDYNRSWSTDTPRLTQCLRDVGFTLVPSSLVLLFVLFEFNGILASTARPISHNKYNVCRLLICFFGIASNLVLLYNYLLYNYVHAIVLENSSLTGQNLGHLVAASAKLLVFVSLFFQKHWIVQWLAIQWIISNKKKTLKIKSIQKFQVMLAVVHHYQRVNGVITSGPIFVANLILSSSAMVLLLDALLYNGPMYTAFERDNVYRTFFCSASLFVLTCFADDAVDAGLRPPPQVEDDETLLNNTDESASSEEKKTANVAPRVYSSFLSRITFFWFMQFFRATSKKRSIHFSDIWDLEDDMKMETQSERYNREFTKEMQRIDRLNQTSTKKIKYTSWSTLKVAYRAYGNEILIANFLKLINDFITFLSPVLLSFMIKFISDPEEKKWHGILLVIAFVSTSVLNNISSSFYTVKVFRVAVNLKSAMMNLVYCKAMRISNKARNKMSSGQIINLMSVDADKFSDFAPFFGKTIFLFVQIL